MVAVVGPYVVVDAGNLGTFTWIVDTRTGAAAESEIGDVVTSGKGVLAGDSPGAVIVHVDQLPGLAC